MQTHWPLLESRPRHGLFFAVMVPVPVADLLASIFDSFRKTYPFGKHRIPNDRLHMSLATMYLGDHLPDTIIDASLRTGDAVQFDKFDIVMNRALSFRNKRARKPFVITADAHTSPTANYLVRQIRHASLLITGRKTDRPGTITPHITLIWDRLCVPEHFITPISLPVREIALVHSHIGQSRYDVLMRWPLGQSGQSTGQQGWPTTRRMR